MTAVEAGTRLTFTKAGHAYSLRQPDGTVQRVRSVTAISGAGRAPQLERWHARITAERAVERWDELAAMPPDERQQTMAGLSTIARDRAAVRGTAVHEIAERLIRGESVDLPDDPDAAAMAEQYASWLSQPQQAWLHAAQSEQRLLIPPAAGLPPVAGTSDLIAADERGRRIILDLKTRPAGRLTPHAEWGPQLWAYGLGHEVDDDGLVAVDAPPRAHAGSIIMIAPDGIRQVWLRGAAWRQAGRMWRGLRLYQASIIPDTAWSER